MGLLYPAEEEAYATRITGIHLPPTAEVAALLLETVAGDMYQMTRAQRQGITRLIMRNYNPYCWKGRKNGDSRNELVASMGLWALSGPAKATFKTASSLDKILLRPGVAIPEKWPSPNGEYGETGDET